MAQGITFTHTPPPGRQDRNREQEEPTPMKSGMDVLPEQMWPMAYWGPALLLWWLGAPAWVALLEAVRCSVLSVGLAVFLRKGEEEAALWGGHPAHPLHEGS